MSTVVQVDKESLDDLIGHVLQLTDAIKLINESVVLMADHVGALTECLTQELEAQE